MVLGKVSFGQMPIVQPQKRGVSVNTRKKMRANHKFALIFYAKSVNWGYWGEELTVLGLFLHKIV